LGDARRRPAAPIGSEAGFSLAEIVITIAIVGITFTAILGGMLTAISVSSQHKKQATADTLARSAAEWVKDPVRNAYTNCAGVNTYGLTGVTIPSGYSVSVTRVEYWNGTAPTGTAYSPTFGSSCPSPDAGLQRITITATAPSSGATETVQLVKRATS
jgi:prepilin-type N-terminal cleavage/methylation domain-containing protein